jgi:hypothetical protein
MDFLDDFVTSEQFIDRAGTLLPKGTVALVVLVYIDVLDVFVTSEQSIARGGIRLPKGAVGQVVLVYGRPGCLRHQRTVHC